MPGPRSAVSQRAGPLKKQSARVGVGVGAAGADRDPFLGGDAEQVGGRVEADGEVVGPAEADQLEPAAPAPGGVDFDVGGGVELLFLAAGDGAPLGPFAAVGPLAAVQFVVAAAADDRVVAGAAVDHVGLLVADQDVVEGRPFDALEAVEAVVAVAAGVVFGQRDLDAAVLAGADVGREGGDVADARAAVHAVVAVVAVDQVVVAGAAAQGVDAEAAGDLVVVAGAAEDGVVAEVADHPVAVAGAAVEDVVAAAAVDQVGTRRRRRSGRCRGCRGFRRRRGRPRSRRGPGCRAVCRRRRCRRSSARRPWQRGSFDFGRFGRPGADVASATASSAAARRYPPSSSRHPRPVTRGA